MVTWAVPQRHVLTSSKTCLSLLLLKITKITNYPQIAKYTCVYLYVVSQKVEVDYSASQLATCTLLARKQPQIILLASYLLARKYNQIILLASYLLARKYNQIILLASQLAVRCQLESTIRLFCQQASYLYVVSQKVEVDIFCQDARPL